jgi:hypothetical protein
MTNDFVTERAAMCPCLYGSILYIPSYDNEADLVLYCKSDSMFDITKHIQLERLILL